MVIHGYAYDDENDLMKLVPTLDEQVRETLRSLNEPITKFGEDNMKRRERLIDIIANDEQIRKKFMSLVGYDMDNIDNGTSNGDNMETTEDQEMEEDEEEDEEFFTEGPAELFNVRKSIADFSLRQAQLRIEKEMTRYNENSDNEKFIEVLNDRRELNSKLKSIELFGSQVVSNRYTSLVRYSNDANHKYIASGSWDGKTYIMDSSNLENKYILVGHEDKIGGVDWAPKSSNTIATSGNEGHINIYKIDETNEVEKKSIKSSMTLKGHASRVARIQFHPMGSYLTSASFDLTWRLWDVTKGTELYYQEGHSNEVFTLANQQDGSLLATGGLDAISRIWDLRTGRSIAVLEDHIKGIYSMDWRMNGYELLTGGADNMIKVWDLRKSSKPKENIVNHTGLISDIRICKETDNFMISSSYDGSVNIYSCDNWVLLKKLKNSEKQMSCDIGKNNNGELNIISGGWDRCVKLYS